MLEHILSGGWLLLPLGLFSVLALAICLNRFWALAINRVLPTQLQHQLTVGLETRDLRQARDPSSLQIVVEAVLTQRETSFEMAGEALDDVLIAEVHKLEKYLTTLGSIASISPLLGLLGTVLGMIDVFYALNQTGSRDPSLFSGGIAQALITTAVGLCIAIPALLCHRHFQRRVDEFALQLEREGKRLMGELFKSTRS